MAVVAGERDADPDGNAVEGGDDERDPAEPGRGQLGAQHGPAEGAEEDGGHDGCDGEEDRVQIAERVDQ